jgi:hypothetical protein
VSDSSNFLTPVHMWKYAAWAQDDWRVTNKLTLNLGARYDLIWNAFAQNVTFLPFELPNRPQDANNIQPRLGFAYQLTDKTVLRGGAGLYYNDELNTNVLWPMSPLTIAVINVSNTPQRADFVANPFNGPLPTYAQALQRFCNPGGGAPDNPAYTAWAASGFRGAAPCLLRALQEMSPISGLLARDAQLAELDRHRAAVRDDDGAAGGLRADQQPEREVDPGQCQCDVQPCDRRSVSVLRRRAPRVSAVWRRRQQPAHRQVGSVRHAEQPDKAVVQSLAGERHIHAQLVLLHGSTAAQRAVCIHRPVPIDMGGERSLSAFDQRHRAVFQRHLGRRARLPGERHLLLRLRDTRSDRVRLRCSWAADLRASIVSAWTIRRGRTAASSRATASSASRFIAWTCG